MRLPKFAQGAIEQALDRSGDSLGGALIPTGRHDPEEKIIRIGHPEDPAFRGFEEPGEVVIEFQVDGPPGQVENAAAMVVEDNFKYAFPNLADRRIPSISILLFTKLRFPSMVR